MAALAPETLGRFRKVPAPATATATAPSAPERPKPQTPSAAPLPQKPKWFAHEIPSPMELLLAHRTERTPYKWQVETLYQLAGYNLSDLDAAPLKPTDKNPFYYNLVAANGSGKDQIVISSFAVWFVMTKIRSRVVITSSAYEQLKDQTFKYIKTLCEDINAFHGRKVFEIVEFHITCNDTGGEIKCFVTDDPGKAEGRHPFEDYPGAEMAVIINEAKSISDEMFQAFSRFTGYNYWLEISSPGKNSGHFYKRCTLAEHQWPQPVELGKFYWRRVTAYDCDHLLGKHIDNLKLEYGEHSLIFRSQVLAEFTSLDEAAYISSLLFENYPTLPPRTFGLPARAGLDLALGGDETVLYVFLAGRFHIRTTKVRDERALAPIIVSWFKEFGLAAENIAGDDGGIGRQILNRIQDLGYDIRRVRNEMRAANPNFFKNRGVENWARLKRMVEDKMLPNITDEETIKQLTTRSFEVRGVVTYLETKKDMKARGLSSPDRADALALCFDGVPFAELKAATEEQREALSNEQHFQLLLMKMQQGKILTTEEQVQFQTLFQLIAESRKPAQLSLNETESNGNNVGRVQDFLR